MKQHPPHSLRRAHANAKPEPPGIADIAHEVDRVVALVARFGFAPCELVVDEVMGWPGNGLIEAMATALHQTHTQALGQGDFFPIPTDERFIPKL
ncbi:hypothetical protein [Rhodoferax sp.]|uniref:hypothetical protein n=1 Tax=Rhodoferax sp. TaxID=50421 RepID=UPI002624BD42|nr:hypothetical protein [Rhodoferax sp.]MDD2809447.1 hypothetical protein [Rhodoferax sp.]